MGAKKRIVQALEFGMYALNKSLESWDAYLSREQDYTTNSISDSPPLLAIFDSSDRKPPKVVFTGSAAAYLTGMVSRKPADVDIFVIDLSYHKLLYLMDVLAGYGFQKRFDTIGAYPSRFYVVENQAFGVQIILYTYDLLESVIRSFDIPQHRVTVDIRNKRCLDSILRSYKVPKDCIRTYNWHDTISFEAWKSAPYFGINTTPARLRKFINEGYKATTEIRYLADLPDTYSIRFYPQRKLLTLFDKESKRSFEYQDVYDPSWITQLLLDMAVIA